ncbi:MAG: hypothetical protein OIF56_11125 [Cohaesibacter sp.]|nr:hypothetical protein [Cohaesibacter sp.]
MCRISCFPVPTMAFCPVNHSDARGRKFHMSVLPVGCTRPVGALSFTARADKGNGFFKDFFTHFLAKRFIQTGMVLQRSFKPLTTLAGLACQVFRRDFFWQF